MEDEVIVTAVPTPSPSRCLICYCELTNLEIKSEPKFHEADVSPIAFDSNCSFTTVSGESPEFSKQQYAYFVLRNVLELSTEQLEAKLQFGGSLETWVRLCEQCHKKVRNVKKIHDALQVISRKYEEAKAMIQEIIRTSQTQSAQSNSDSGNRCENGGMINAVDHCRDIVCKRKEINSSEVYCSSIDPFTNVDLIAQPSLENRDTEIAPEFDCSGDVAFENVDVDVEVKMEAEVEIELEPNIWLTLDSDPLCNDDYTIDTAEETPTPTTSKPKLSPGRKKKPTGKKPSASKRVLKTPTLAKKTLPVSSVSKIGGKGLKNQKQKSSPHGSRIYKMSCACNLCGKTWINKSKLARHMAQVHKIGEFKCRKKDCDLVFHSRKTLETHVKCKHRGLKIPKGYTCVFCGRECPSPATLKEHVDAMHINNERKPFKCAQCDQRFPTEDRLKRHFRRMHVRSGGLRTIVQ